jgi:SAM-dependent methyltransferase
MERGDCCDDRRLPQRFAAVIGMTTRLAQALAEQERAWRERPLVRALYDDWFSLVQSQLSPVPGLAVELGAGIGKFREKCPWVVATDVEPTKWAQEIVDAQALPYEDGQLASLILIDVFHHLPRPARFLDEAARTLRPGGRAIVLDPYCSPVSTVLYRRFHRERADMNDDPFRTDASVVEDPLASNQALATLAFFKRRGELARRWPALRLVDRRRLALLTYPLSGGFTGRRLIPWRVGLALRRLEPLAAPLAPVLAFRCLVVLERH